MLRKQEFLKTHPVVRTGMGAYSVTGERLGVVERLSEDGVMIAGGRIIHREFYVPYDDIEEVRAEDIVLRPSGESRGRTREGRSQDPWEEHRYGGPEAERKAPGRMRERDTGGYGGQEEQAGVPAPKTVSRRRTARTEGEVRASSRAGMQQQQSSNNVHERKGKVDRTGPERGR